MNDSAYIDFLRWCLHPTGNIPACTSTINWQELLAFAKKQTIVGIYWQGIQRIGDIPNKPSEDNVMDWMGAYTKIVRRNVKTDDAVAKLTKFMHDNGIVFLFLRDRWWHLITLHLKCGRAGMWTSTFSRKIGHGLNTYWKRMSR